MELDRKLNPSFQNARIPTEHPLLLHVCAIAYTCKSNCLFMYKQQTQRVIPGRTVKGGKTFYTPGPDNSENVKDFRNFSKF